MVVDNDRLVLMMWLVLEERADGIPVRMMLLQDGKQQTIADALISAGLCTKEEVDLGVAQERVKPKIHMLWTPARFRVKEEA